MEGHGMDGGEEEARRLREEARFLEEEARRLQDEERRLEDRAHALEDRAEAIEERQHHGPGGGDHGGDGRILVKVVVTGTPVEVEAHRDHALRTLVLPALELSGNVGQPPEKWELKDEHGNVLDLERPIGSICAEGELTLFLSLIAGVAGA